MPVPNNLPSLTPRSTSKEVALKAGLLGSAIPGTETRRSRYAPVPAPRKSVSAVVKMATEPDDAHITGATRSLSRRLLALNVRQAS